ncbi:hypothetical protein Esi_0155_0020 [Ectocarpus siliculosus]|uniref:Uncharacterized protein n=1 Tax=Ectocarpus siliculosus TaxID=2880 RepID=D8LFZ8_ECTSI|nr:hypothetical protein Esi_0155_0020 [Ectocarpus siliculosus]|eukprot:CBN78897.1 hypothetical protein Esi_0155_0020 [Ectocarpus siliculosus]
MQDARRTLLVPHCGSVQCGPAVVSIRLLFLPPQQQQCPLTEPVGILQPRQKARGAPMMSICAVERSCVAGSFCSDTNLGGGSYRLLRPVASSAADGEPSLRPRSSAGGARVGERCDTHHRCEAGYRVAHRGIDA